MYLRKGRALRAYSTHCLWKGRRRSEGSWRKSGDDVVCVTIKGRMHVKLCPRALLTAVASNVKNASDFSGIPIKDRGSRTEAPSIKSYPDCKQ